MPPQREAAVAVAAACGDPRMTERIAVIGLGYVGLPVALAVGRKFPTVGFDIAQRRVEALNTGHDWTGETTKTELKDSHVRYSNNADDLKGADVFVVCVPTPI